MRLIDRAIAAVQAAMEEAGDVDVAARRRRLVIVGSPDNIRKLRHAEGGRAHWSDPVAGADPREAGRFAGVPVLDIGFQADPTCLSVLLGARIVSTISTLRTIPGPLFYMALRSLFGADFHKPARQTFNVEDKTLRDWIAGRRPIPDGVVLELDQAIANRAAELGSMLTALRGG